MSYSNPKIDAVFDGIEARILQELEKARFSIQIAMAWWTNGPLTQKIEEKANEGVQVDIIVWNDNPFNSDISIPERLIEAGVTLLSYIMPPNGKFHHKFCIIDQQVIITGSYNWTYSAENRNEENIVVIKDSKIVESYLDQFYKFIPNAEFYDIPQNLPTIKLFANKKFIQEGEKVEIHWNIQNAVEFEIDDLLESDEQQGITLIKLFHDTSFNIIARNGEKEITKKLDIRLYKKPNIELAVYTKGFNSDRWVNARSFTKFDGYHIFEGQPVKLRWFAENVDSLVIDGKTYDVADGMTGIASNVSRTILVEVYNRNKRIEKEVTIFVTPIPKFDTFKTPIPDPIEVKFDFTFENVTVPSTLELLDISLLSKVNFPKIKDLKVAFNSNKPTIVKRQPLLLHASTEDVKIFPTYDTEHILSKTAYIKPSFRETWKKYIKTNSRIINHIKELFKPNGK